MWIAVDTDHAMTQIRETGGGYTTYVTETNDRDLGVILSILSNLHFRLL
jgi:hypothetical protein